MSWANLVFAIVPMVLATAPAEAPREPIGTVLGEPIYRDQLRGEFPVRGELFRLIRPATQRYRERHRDEIEPTDAEVVFAARYFRKEDPDRWREKDAEWKAELAEIQQMMADPDFASLPAEERRNLEARKRFLTRFDPALFFAKFALDSRKFNRHLYETFGGGRLLWQQGGVEAFDAHRRWLETLEARGDFWITDPELRAAFYDYWTNERRHGSFLFTPEKNPQVFEEFLNPEWFPADGVTSTESSDES